MRRILTVALVLALVAGATLSAAKFKSVWKSPDVDKLGFAGKKIAAVVIAADQSMQMSTEEALARELTSRTVNGVPSYRIVPRPELKDPAKVKVWFEQAKIEGAVILRVINSEKQVSYDTSMWVGAGYGSMWDYYGMGWNAVMIPVNATKREDLVVTIEILVYDLAKDKLVWAAVSEQTNPKDAQKIVKEIVKDAVAEMRKGGLVPKDAK